MTSQSVSDDPDQSASYLTRRQSESWTTDTKSTLNAVLNQAGSNL